jgi:tRNA(His) 5'-end guanylyltransferase
LFRQKDATRNSILSVGQANFSHKELHGKNTDEIQDMLFKEKGINWNDFEPKYKRGRVIIKEQYTKGEAIRSLCITTECPIFSQDPDFIYKLLPNGK